MIAQPHRQHRQHRPAVLPYDFLSLSVLPYDFLSLSSTQLNKGYCDRDHNSGCLCWTVSDSVIISDLIEVCCTSYLTKALRLTAAGTPSLFTAGAIQEQAP